MLIRNRVLILMCFSIIMSAYQLYAETQAALGRTYYESLQKDLPTSIENNNLLGRSYYNFLIEESQERKWAVPILFHYNFTDCSFDDESQSRNLSHLVFGLCQNKIQIKDIYLISKLADERKMHIDLVPMDAMLNIQPLPLPAVRPIGSKVPFGNYRSDQYVALLSDVEICFDADRREMGVDVGTMYHSRLRQSSVVGTIGINVPIKTVINILDVSFVGGELFNEVFTPDVTLRENTLNEFFNDFSSIEDFFNRAILEPKGLHLEKRNRKTGLGDVVFYGQLDFAEYIRWTDGLEVGLNIILPTADKEDPDQVWEPVLGNGGAFQFDFYFNALFNSPSSFFNPQIGFVIELSAPYTHERRVSQVKKQTETTQVSNNPCLLASVFCEYFIDPFEECDVTVSRFADQKIKTKTKLGTQYLFTLGNYFYNVFDIGFRLGVLYQYLHKTKDSVIVDKACKNFSQNCNCGVALLERRTDAKAHTIGWNLSYLVKDRIELNIGSQHIVAGKNMPRTYELFVSFVAVF